MAHETTPDTAFYPPRSSEGIKEVVEALSRPPEFPLSDRDKEAALSFEASLMNGKLELPDGTVLESGSNRPLDQVVAETSNSDDKHELVAEYLVTDESRAALAEVGAIIPADATPAQALTEVERVALGGDATKFKNLRVASKKWATDRISEALVEGEVPPSFVRQTVFTNLDKLVTKMQEYGNFRRFYRDVNTVLKLQPDSRLVEAERALTRVYSKVMNGKIAANYPDMLAAWDQLNQVGNEAAEAALRLAWPQAEAMASRRSETRERFIVGLDRIRNGTALEHGTFTSIPNDLRAVFDTTRPQAERHAEKAFFTPQETERFSGIRFNAEQMQLFAKDVLAELGLLSNEPESTYSKDRPHRAADGKWQVVILPDVTAMGAEDPSGGFQIPADFNRNLTKVTAPVGVVPGLAHELMHIYQHDNVAKSRAGLALARAESTHGRSSLVLREAGSVYAEQLVQQRLFGVTRPYSPHFLRAVDVLEHDGSEAEATKAFYDSYRAANPTESPESAANVAVSRVARVATRFGGFNSQPLDYAETALVVRQAEQLSDTQRNRLLAEGILSPADMRDLYQYDLLDSNPTGFPLERFLEIMEVKLRTLLAEQEAEKQ